MRRNSWGVTVAAAIVILALIGSGIYIVVGSLTDTQGIAEETRSASRPEGDGKTQRKNDEVYYYFNLGWRDDYYDDDDAFHKGYRAGGTLTIYVNDSPVSMYSQNGQIYRISPFLKPGKNTIRVSGKHTEKIWIKVLLANPEEMLKVLKARKLIAKTWLEPENDSTSLEFDAQVSGPPEFDELAQDPKGRAAHEKEVRQLVDQLLAAYAKHDVDSFNQLLLPAIKSPPQYAKHREELLKWKEEFARMVNNRKEKLLTKRDDVKIVYGARSVVLYSGDHDGSPFFLDFDTGERNSLSFLDAITLVRIGGKWTLTEERTCFPFSFGM
jgi:hypothetical protein